MASKTFLSKYSNQIYGLMRVVIGILFFSHGVQKASALLSGAMSFNNTLIVLACIIELVAGFMIVVGLQTRWAAFIASGEMAVAYFKAISTPPAFVLSQDQTLQEFDIQALRPHHQARAR